MGDDRQANARRLRVCTEEEFLEAVRTERVRCDRSGQVFTLVELAVPCDTPGRQELSERIATRVRACDRVGLLNGGEIAIMLPGTDRAGAAQLLTEITRMAGCPSDLADRRVSSYPATNGSSGHGLAGGSYSPLDEALAPICALTVPRWKRILDVTGAVVGLLLFLPLFVFLPVYIKLVSPGPVFFKQQRVGYRGRLFTFIKFRTMRIHDDCSGHREHLSTLIKSDRPMTKLDETPDRRDPRVYRGANLLRKLALDEVPQFINILRGDMSLVGPRPCIPYEAAEYAKWHTQRFDVMPGLTGLWQVSGKNRLSFADMVRLDNTYARTMSFWLDVKILLLTIPMLLAAAAESMFVNVSRAGGRRAN